MQSYFGGFVFDIDNVWREVIVRDCEIENEFIKDVQIGMLCFMCNYCGDKFICIVVLYWLQDLVVGLFIVVKLYVFMWKLLGGINIDFDGCVFCFDGFVIFGLYVVGEVSGFGGGGVYGYCVLEGIFFGGCLFLGCQVGCVVVC